MNALVRLACAAAFAGTAFVGAAASPKAVPDPEAFSAGLIQLLSKHETDEAAHVITSTLDTSDAAGQLKAALAKLKDKPLDYSDKVIDRQFGKSLRQIVYYCYFDRFGFVYFRFNFKMTRQGWWLANFNFKTENEELFPKDFMAPQP